LVLRHVTVVTTAAAMSMPIDGNQRRTLHIIGRDSTAMNGNTLESNQPLSDLLVGGSINTVALEIAKEVVQGIIVTFSGVERSVLANFTSMADRIVNGAVGSLLLGSVVARVGRVV
jgi:hypothetical protein